jgi:hypothetical protein
MGLGGPVIVVGLESGSGLLLVRLALGTLLLLIRGLLGLPSLRVLLPAVPPLGRRGAGPDTALVGSWQVGGRRQTVGLRGDQWIGGGRPAAGLRTDVIFPAVRVVDMPGEVVEVGLGTRRPASV